MSASRWLLCIAMIATGLSAAAQTTTPWKWRDKAGQVHISDMPPPRDIGDKDILQRPTVIQRQVAAQAAAAASAASVAASGAKADPELEARRQRARQEQEARAKVEDAAQAAVRAENCKRAQSYMRTLEDGRPQYRYNDKGEREVIDDQLRAAEVQRARQTIASDCR
ncbi:MAG TPA: DUF4124 domain-containing protein [Burkholderiaceae bacterium]